MGVQPDQGAYDEPCPASSDNKRKRKRRSTADHSPTHNNVTSGAALRRVDSDEEVAYGESVAEVKKKAKKPKGPSSAVPAAEKRLRRFRPEAPSSFHAIYERATTQRFFLLSRTRRGTNDCPEELFELTGSTGNIYRVHIQKQPTCSCPHAKAGNQCKHIVWCLKSILRAPDAHVYQLALLSTELCGIFANAPAPADESSPGKDKNRKTADGDCPICFEEMQAGDAKEPLVWCKAACGQNIHKECFEMWAATKRAGGGGGRTVVSCPYCRSAWEGGQ
ncbi:putative SWIM zinc finger protein [Diaporthe ampelina]|uniref:Putative SWIM zinc finger protein n=1 Tax=Diaporthe ampelina TaxID=1214573 RepID=A0A0G2IF38_9PEZI|nr:putative SWIM zinc finger protein [Diaporthe ampelina]